LNPWPPA